MPRRAAKAEPFVEANARYERWLGAELALRHPDLRRKHAAMAEAAFPFLRATFFRWAERWPAACPELLEAPRVLAVGDLHVENFGTWRDLEGRLVWGVNDYDEAWPLPYTNDLVRLTASVVLAIEHHDLVLAPEQAAAAILEGYEEALTAGPQPFVLAEHHHALHDMAVHRLKNPKAFWDKLERMPKARRKPPPAVRRALRRELPDADLDVRFVHRISGLGSLGRIRWVAIAAWHGGRVAREAKALAPSACAWATRQGRNARIYFRRMLGETVGYPDPFLRVKRRWIIRRLAPDCSRIDLAALPRTRDELSLLQAMGTETANVHLGSTRAKLLRADLRARPAGWLSEAARRMSDLVRTDWRAWRAHWRKAGN
jgi:hypothetical protein